MKRWNISYLSGHALCTQAFLKCLNVPALHKLVPY